MSVMTLALASGGTSADATATKWRAARQRLRDASILRTGASGAATNAACAELLTNRCDVAELRTGAQARARATPRARDIAAAGRAAVSAIVTSRASCGTGVMQARARWLWTRKGR